MVLFQLNYLYKSLSPLNSFQRPSHSVCKSQTMEEITVNLFMILFLLSREFDYAVIVCITTTTGVLQTINCKNWANSFVNTF